MFCSTSLQLQAYDLHEIGIKPLNILSACRQKYATYAHYTLVGGVSVADCSSYRHCTRIVSESLRYITQETPRTSQHVLSSYSK